MTKYDNTVDHISFKFRICLIRIGLNNIFWVKKEIQILFILNNNWIAKEFTFVLVP